MKFYQKFFLVHNPESGQGAIGFVFLLGGVVVLVALVLAFLVISFANTTTGFQAANRALAAAGSGAEDALMRLSRNKSFSANPPTGGYNVPLNPPTGFDFATVTVEQNLPAPGQATINSFAIVAGSQRKIRVIASIAPSTGSVGVLSWQQEVF